MAIVAFLVYVFETNDPSHPSLPGLAIAAVAFIIYGQFAARDVGRSLVSRDFAPKRYADTED